MFLSNIFHLLASDVDIICVSPVLLTEKSSSDLIQLFTKSMVELGIVPDSWGVEGRWAFHPVGYTTVLYERNPRKIKEIEYLQDC